jgi:REP element-mobilizing transposase RayT
MSQSLSNVLIHLVFSTKNRIKYISSEIEQELYSYLAKTCQSHDCPVLKIGGVEDHVHLLCQLARTVTISKLVEQVKKGSSKWIKTKGPQFSGFFWQNGYGAFSIGASQISVLRNYIQNQKDHHQRVSFMDEYRELLKKYQIKYDERYVWD